MFVFFQKSNKIRIISIFVCETFFLFVEQLVKLIHLSTPVVKICLVELLLDSLTTASYARQTFIIHNSEIQFMYIMSEKHIIFLLYLNDNIYYINEISKRSRLKF